PGGWTGMAGTARWKTSIARTSSYHSSSRPPNSQWRRSGGPGTSQLLEGTPTLPVIDIVGRNWILLTRGEEHAGQHDVRIVGTDRTGREFIRTEIESLGVHVCCRERP